jgi:regulatory protein
MSTTITKIERQKKNKQRYSLFAEERFIIGVSEESLLKFNIYSGKTLSDDILTEIETRENYIAIREQAWRFLARRMHSEKELEIKLINKGYDKDIIGIIIQDLRAKRYLDDKAFAQQVISDEAGLKRSGPVYIKNKLLQKGVEISLVSSLIEENYSAELQHENCKYFAAKKFKYLENSNSNSIKNKLGNFLIQKGFTWEMINLVISELDQSR